MRKAPVDRGFFISFAFNLLFRSWWGGLALLLWLLRFWLKIIPWFLPLALLGVWLLSALFVTVLLSLVSRIPSKPAPPQRNKNPYSAKTEDVFGGAKAANGNEKNKELHGRPQ